VTHDNSNDLGWRAVVQPILIAICTSPAWAAAWLAFLA
jgi:hypothetical protein